MYKGGLTFDEPAYCSGLVMILQMLRCLIAALVLGAVDAQCFERVEQWIEHHRDLKTLRALLASNCTLMARDIIEASGTQDITIFAPIDSAWRSAFQMGSPRSLRNLRCSENALTAHDCFQIFSSHNTSQLPLEDVAPCLSLLTLYHVSPERHDELFNTTVNGSNITVIPSLLGQHNSTELLMPYNMTQMLIANTTTDGTLLQGGDNTTARIINTYYGNNGRLYLIDKVLFPPMPLNYTVESLNSSVPVDDNFLDRNITVFIPVGDDAAQIPPGFNVSSYVVPEIIYLNDTMSGSLNLSAIDGNQLLVRAENNDTILVGNNATVTRANIPLVNGVLHLINGTTGAFNISRSFQAQTLRRNWNHWRRWAFA